MVLQPRFIDGFGAWVGVRAVDENGLAGVSGLAQQFEQVALGAPRLSEDYRFAGRAERDRLRQRALQHGEQGVTLGVAPDGVREARVPL